MALSEAQVWREAAVRAKALKIVADVRDQTVDVCIAAIESLKRDNQGFVLDAGTIDACVNILHNLKSGRAALGEGQ